MTYYCTTVIALTGLLFAACVSTGAEDEPAPPDENPATALADVVSVSVSGTAGDYAFSVGVRSPDTGCDRYADWWEVISPDGRLLYRRILAHSHVSEQPFVRSGGPVAVGAGDEVIVRAHMHPDGYGGQVFRGTAAGGLAPADLSAEFASELAEQDPRPTGCAG